MKLKIFLTGMTVLFIVTVSGQGYEVKSNQGDGALLKSAVLKHRLDSIISIYQSMTTKREFIFDTNDIQTEYNYYLWINNRWKLNINQKYHYNEYGKLSKFIYSWYGGTSGPMVSEVSYVYDGAGKLKEGITDKGDKYKFTYDITGNVTECTWYPLNGNPYKYETITYDANGNPTEFYLFTITGAVDLQEKFDYDASGNIIRKSIYDALGGPDTLYCSYDSYGNPLNDNRYFWKNNLHKLYQKTEYTYDNTLSFSDLILPFLSDLQLPLDYCHMSTLRRLASKSRYFNHKLLGYNGISEYESGYNVTFFYSNVLKSTSSSVEIHNEVAYLYPNPVSGKLFFSFANNYSRAMFQLFDIRGSKIVDKEITQNQYINIENLKPGLYLYNLVNGKKRQCGKLIKY